MLIKEDYEDAVFKANHIRSILKYSSIPAAKTVVDIGCGDGLVLLEFHRIYPTTSCFGFDTDASVISKAYDHEDGEVCFQRRDFILQPFQHHITLLIDVLEHQEDPYTFLRKLKPYSKLKVLHIPLENTCLTMLYPTFQKHQHDTVGHRWYFTKDTAFQMLEDCGYKIIRWEYTHCYKLSRWYGWKDAVLKPVRYILFAIWPDIAQRMVGGCSVMVVAE